MGRDDWLHLSVHSGLGHEGWLDEIPLTIPTDVQSVYQTWQLGKEKRKEKRERQFAFKKAIDKSIKQARRSSRQADQGWRLMRFFNGGVSLKQLLMVVMTLVISLLITIFTSGSGAVIHELFELILAISLGILMLILYSDLWILVVHADYHSFMSRSVNEFERLKSSASESELRRRLFDDQLIHQFSNEYKLEQIAREYLENIASSEMADYYYSPALRRHVKGEISLLKLYLVGNVFTVINLLWICFVYPVLIVLWAVFVFANHQTRLVAMTAVLTSLSYLSLSHLYLGGIALENGQYVFGLILASAGASWIVHRLGKGSAKPFREKFRRPAITILHPSNVR